MGGKTKSSAPPAPTSMPQPPSPSPSCMWPLHPGPTHPPTIPHPSPAPPAAPPDSPPRRPRRRAPPRRGPRRRPGAARGAGPRRGPRRRRTAAAPAPGMAIHRLNAWRWGGRGGSDESTCVVDKGHLFNYLCYLMCVYSLFLAGLFMHTCGCSLPTGVYLVGRTFLQEATCEKYSMATQFISSHPAFRVFFWGVRLERSPMLLGGPYMALRT